MNNCDHWKRGQEWVEEKDEWTGEAISDWKPYAINTCEDIDLHRWRCTQCGLVGYYSSWAREEYEGKKS